MMASDVAPGSDIAGYILEEQLGGGGFGAVWRARHPATADIVAIKLLTGAFADGAGGLRADIELLAATASHRSQHVVKVLGGGSDPVPHVVMEFIDGTDLAAQLRDGALTTEQAIHVGLGIADALSALEAAGIVHRDVKPANVMIDAAGVVKLTDFGIAKIVGYDTITMTGQLPMTMAYAAPEVWEGTSTHRSDLYAMGVLLYQCLRGVPPFIGNYGSLFKQHTADLPDLDALPHDTPASLREMIRACMEKDPDARPRNGAECIEMLHRATAELTSPAVPEPERFGPWIRQRRHQTQPWAWRCVHSQTGEHVVVEVHASNDVATGARLRDAVAANAFLAPLGAEILLGTNRVMLRPGEAWQESPAGDMQFWVARGELPSERTPQEVTVPRLRRAVDSLLSLVDVAAAHGVALALDSGLVSMRADGAIHVKRPGIAAPAADPLSQAMEFLRSLPLDEDARAFVADAPDLRTLRAWLPFSATGAAADRDAAEGQTVLAPIGGGAAVAPARGAYAEAALADGAPPVKRGWFHAGIRVARMYWYVGAGVTMFAGVMLGTLGGAFALGNGGSGTGPAAQAKTTTALGVVIGDGATSTWTPDQLAFINGAAGGPTAAGGTPPPTGVGAVAGDRATPRPGETALAAGSTPIVIVVPPGGGPTNTPVPAVPPLVVDDEPTPTPYIVIPPPPTNMPKPTNTPTPSVPTFGTGSITWQEYDGPPHNGGRPIGPAMTVCLNAVQPPNCTGYQYGWSGAGWGLPEFYQPPFDRFRGAQWIFSSIINRDTMVDTKPRYFHAVFTMEQVPAHARFYLMADNVIDVWLNFDELLWSNTIAAYPCFVDVDRGAADPSCRSDPSPARLVQGLNDFDVLIWNDACVACTYQENPAGFIIGNPTAWDD